MDRQAKRQKTFQHIILDGGTGKELAVRINGATGQWKWEPQTVRTHRKLLTEVHRDFAVAGANVITTWNFICVPKWLKKEGSEDEFLSLTKEYAEAACEGVKLSGREGVRVAGSLPPLDSSYRFDLTPDDDTLRAVYASMATALVDGGADLLLCETMSSLREAKGALSAAMTTGKQVWVAFTLDEAPGVPKLKSGETLGDAAREVAAMGASSILVNCCPPEIISAAMPVLKDCGVPFGGYAHAFELFDLKSFGHGVIRELRGLTPEDYASFTDAWICGGASIVGGCCGCRPAHIKSVSDSRIGSEKREGSVSDNP